MDNRGIINNGIFLKFFNEISKIPRGSGNEKEVSNYLVNFAKERNLEVYQDEAFNVLIKKRAYPKYEDRPVVIIQGHMDMVCDKNNGIEHDFKRDPIELFIDNDMIYAKQTTLGADNGIAIAYALALLDSKDIPHPPLKVLLTTSEEVGLIGAAALSEKYLDGKYLINLDSEEEGIAIAGCAGGIRTNLSLPISHEKVKKGFIPYLISIGGLKGGHSGGEIDKGRGNSNKLIGRLLSDLYGEIQYQLSSISGGNKLNAIPREADAVILIDPIYEEKLIRIVKRWDKVFKSELRVTDTDVNVSVKKLDQNVKDAFFRETAEKVLTMIMLMPNGVRTFDYELKGLVESSVNLGVITTSKDFVEMKSAVRSSVRTLKHTIVQEQKALAKLVNANFSTESDYCEWQYNPNSCLIDIVKTIYSKKFGKEMAVTSIHGGLECGLFKEKNPELDMISIGPNIFDVHTPNEHVSISSAKRTYELLCEVIKSL